MQTLVRLPKALLYLIGCRASKEQEAQVSRSLRQGQHLLALLGRNDDILHPGHPAGLLQPHYAPVNAGVGDGDHHHPMGSRGQSETGNIFAHRVAKQEPLQTAVIESQNPRAQASDGPGRRGGVPAAGDSVSSEGATDEHGWTRIRSRILFRIRVCPC